jgi:hypothetical protein
LEFFAKICRDIRKSRCTTSDKFCAGVNYSGGKFVTGINDTPANLREQVRQLSPKVNIKKKIYLYVNSTPNKIWKTFQSEDIFPFATGVTDIGRGGAL